MDLGFCLLKNGLGFGGMLAVLLHTGYPFVSLAYLPPHSGLSVCANTNVLVVQETDLIV